MCSLRNTSCFVLVLVILIENYFVCVSCELCHYKDGLLINVPDLPSRQKWQIRQSTTSCTTTLKYNENVPLNLTCFLKREPRRILPFKGLYVVDLPSRLQRQYAESTTYCTTTLKYNDTVLLNQTCFLFANVYEGLTVHYMVFDGDEKDNDVMCRIDTYRPNATHIEIITKLSYEQPTSTTTTSAITILSALSTTPTTTSTSTVPTSATSENTPRSPSTGLIVGCSLGGVALAVLVSGIIWKYRTKCRLCCFQTKPELVYSYASVEQVSHYAARALMAGNKRLGERDFTPHLPPRPDEHIYDYATSQVTPRSPSPIYSEAS